MICNKYNVDESEYNKLICFKKADVQICIMIIICNIVKIENLSLKKANSDTDYNQIDKRTVFSLSGNVVHQTLQSYNLK